ncbi:MAG: radical SAM protein [bacterium]
MNAATKFLYHKTIDRKTRWYPMLSVYYLNYACSFRCPYCSDGAGRPYYALPRDILPGPEVVRLLGRIRRHCDHVVITGGEPLEHPDVTAVLEALPSLRFEEVIFTTNGFGLAPYLPAIARGVTTLVVSLDTLDHAKADAWFGVGDGTLASILGDVERARALPARRYGISISSVVTPDNIEDLYGVYEYAAERDFEFAACPELQGVFANSALHGHLEYIRLFDFLIAEKKRGRRVFGTVKYLERMRDLVKYRCRPFTMLVVSPTGEVFYPCLELGHYAGNLFDTNDLHGLRREGERRFGPQPDCGTQCHSACALGFATALESSATVIQEAYLQSKSWFRRKRR